MTTVTRAWRWGLTLLILLGLPAFAVAQSDSDGASASASVETDAEVEVEEEADTGSTPTVTAPGVSGVEDLRVRSMPNRRSNDEEPQASESAEGVTVGNNPLDLVQIEVEDVRTADRSLVNDQLPEGGQASSATGVSFFDDRLAFTMDLIVEGHYHNNADMRRLDTRSLEAIRDSDDQGLFAYSQLFAGLGYQVLGGANDPVSLIFETQLSYSGMWGNDRLLGTAANVISLWRLNFSLNVTDVLTVRVGRQAFRSGTRPARDPSREFYNFRDFYFRDTIDGVTVQLKPSDQVGTFNILAFDLFGGGSGPGNLDFASFLKLSGEEVDGFNGDVNTYRFGLVYENNTHSFNPELPWISWSVFGFFMRYGAGDGGGADRTENGQLGNFADNDWNTMAGARLAIDMPIEGTSGNISAWVDGAFSAGIDRKQRPFPNPIATTGFAFTAGAELQFEIGDSFNLLGLLDGVFSSGGQYGSNGAQYNHGFTSFKGDQFGGLLIDQYAGFHPSAYTDDDGFDYSPHNINRKAGLAGLHLGAVFGIELNTTDTLNFGVDAYMMWDTNSSSIDIERVRQGLIDPPYTYTDQHLWAQERFGQLIGFELDGSVFYNFSNKLDLYLRGAVFFPGGYYDVPVERVVGTAVGARVPEIDSECTDGRTVPNCTGAADTFVGLAVGTRLRF